MKSFFNLKTVTIFAFFIAFSIFIWLLNAKPVLVEWYYGIKFGSVCDPPLVILNPLRSREAEKSANEFLKQLKNDNLEVLNSLNLGSERLEQIKDSESNSKIKSWFSGNRNETETKVSITYWVEREFEGGCQSLPTGIELKSFDGDWKVVDFHPIY